MDGRISIVYHINFLTQMLFEKNFEAKGISGLKARMSVWSELEKPCLGWDCLFCTLRWISFEADSQGRVFPNGGLECFFFLLFSVIYGVSRTHILDWPHSSWAFCSGHKSRSYLRNMSSLGVLLFFSSFFSFFGAVYQWQCGRNYGNLDKAARIRCHLVHRHVRPCFAAVFLQLQYWAIE